MKPYNKIRLIESLSIPILSSVWITYAIFLEIRFFDDLILSTKRAKVPLTVVLKDLEHYEPLLNINLPFIAGGILIFAGWYLFHFEAYPKISRFQANQTGLFYFFISVILVFSGIFVFYFFRQNLSFRYWAGDIRGLSTSSSFRKLNLAKETLKWAVLIGLYELVTQAIYYISEKRYKKLDIRKFTIFNTLIVFLLCATALFYTLNQTSSSSQFFLMGLLLQMTLLSRYVYYVLLPYYPLFNSWEFKEKFVLYIILAVVSSFIIQLFIFEKSYYMLYVFQTCVIAFFLPPTVSSLISRFLHEKRILKTQLSSRSAELANLRSQINPHFLFNALNSLYATALNENSEKTADGIQKLGDMMRFMLDENNHNQIPLSSEIAYLHNYIELQRMRLDETQNIEIRVNIQEPGKEIYIAPMLLNPFVENAFKHGISLQNPSWIYITLTLDTGHLYFKVHNSLHQQTGSDPEKNSTGIGLENVEKRLKLIYPDRYNLHIQKSAQDYFASITLTF